MGGTLTGDNKEKGGDDLEEEGGKHTEKRKDNKAK